MIIITTLNVTRLSFKKWNLLKKGKIVLLSKNSFDFQTWKDFPLKKVPSLNLKMNPLMDPCSQTFWKKTWLNRDKFSEMSSINMNTTQISNSIFQNQNFPLYKKDSRTLSHTKRRNLWNRKTLIERNYLLNRSEKSSKRVSFKLNPQDNG